MESAAALLPAVSVFSLSRSLKISPGTGVRCNHSSNLHHRLLWRLPRACRPQGHCVRSGLSSSPSAAICLGSAGNKLPREWFLLSFAGSIISGSRRAAAPGRFPLACLSSLSAAPSGPGGGGDGLGVGNGGGDGDGGSSGGGTETKSISGESEDVSNLGSDVIILDVGVRESSRPVDFRRLCCVLIPFCSLRECRAVAVRPA